QRQGHHRWPGAGNGQDRHLLGVQRLRCGRRAGLAQRQDRPHDRRTVPACRIVLEARKAVPRRLMPSSFPLEVKAMINAWVAPTAKSKLVRQQVELGPLGAEEVEVQVEYCGLCHSDLSVLNNDWGFSQFPAVLGHEITGRVVDLGPAAKGLKV